MRDPDAAEARGATASAKKAAMRWRCLGAWRLLIHFSIPACLLSRWLQNAARALAARAATTVGTGGDRRIAHPGSTTCASTIQAGGGGPMAALRQVGLPIAAQMRASSAMRFLRRQRRDHGRSICVWLAGRWRRRPRRRPRAAAFARFDAVGGARSRCGRQARRTIEVAPRSDAWHLGWAGWTHRAAAPPHLCPDDDDDDDAGPEAAPLAVARFGRRSRPRRRRLAPGLEVQPVARRGAGLTPEGGEAPGRRAVTARAPSPQARRRRRSRTSHLCVGVGT